MGDTLERLVQTVMTRLDTMEREVITPMVAAVTLLEKKLRDRDEGEEPAKLQPGHVPWRCDACRALLGYYDQERDTLRIRVKDVHVHLHVGVSGWVMVPCRRCGYTTRQEYSPPKG